MKTGFAQNVMSVPLGSSLGATPWSEHAQSLGRHLRTCEAARGWPARAGLWIDRLHALIAPRFVTTVFAASVVLAACTAWA